METFVYDKTIECVQGTPAQCVCACPVNLDVKEFLRKVRAGNINGAYRLLANTFVFPEITTRICDGVCKDECCSHLDLLKIEQMVVREATRTNPQNYVLPDKKNKIAVIGAGLSGLGCAARLGARKYDVTLFEASEQAGGTLFEKIPEEECLAYIANQMKFCRYKLESRTRITSIDEIGGFDAYYIATGKGGEDFGLLASWDSQCMATEKDSVFLGGELTGAGPMEALAHGFVAASSIEKYVQVKTMTGQPGSFIIKDCLLPYIEPLEPEGIIPENGVYYSREEAIKEAERCTNCDCTICMESCEFMKHYKMSPRDIEKNAAQSRNTKKGLIDRVGSRQIFSCSATGHCGAVCPRNISCEEISMNAKRVLFQQGSYPETLHDYYLRDMAAAMDADYMFRCAPGYETAEQMLFIGCSIGESSPEYAKKAFELIRKNEENTGIIMACCGIPALWAGNHELFNQMRQKFLNDWERCGRPKLVIMCPTCMKTIAEYYPEITALSLYEYIDEKGINISGRAKAESFAVFDACSSREFPKMQEAVRNILIRSGICIEELPENSKEKARCCGMGGHIYPANPELAVKMVQHSSRISPLPYIAYCTNCRDLFLTEGKRCLHIMDIVGDFSEKEKVQHIAELRHNRKQLKHDLLKEVWEEESMMISNELVKLKIPEDILKKMDAELISEDEVQEVIYDCEKRGDKLVNEDNQTMVAHKKIGNITYWVEYRPDLDNPDRVYFSIFNVYCHRIVIEDE